MAEYAPSVDSNSTHSTIDSLARLRRGVEVVVFEAWIDVVLLTNSNSQMRTAVKNQLVVNDPKLWNLLFTDNF
jgi:hypothetical protein